MLFKVQWTVKSENLMPVWDVFRSMSEEDHLKSQGPDIKIIGRWHELTGSGGVCILESESSEAITGMMLNWTPFCDTTVTPMIEDFPMKNCLQKASGEEVEKQVEKQVEERVLKAVNEAIDNEVLTAVGDVMNVIDAVETAILTENAVDVIETAVFTAVADMDKEEEENAKKAETEKNQDETAKAESEKAEDDKTEEKIPSFMH